MHFAMQIVLADLDALVEALSVMRMYLQIRSHWLTHSVTQMYSADSDALVEALCDALVLADLLLALVDTLRWTCLVDSDALVEVLCDVDVLAGSPALVEDQTQTACGL